MTKPAQILSITILLFAVLFSSGCGLNKEILQDEIPTATNQAIPTTTREEDEEAIYRYILNEYSPSDNLIVIKEYAEDSHFSDRTLDVLFIPDERVLQETMDDFIVQNKIPSPFAANMELGKEYVVLTKVEMDAIWNGEQDGWEVFRKKHPDSYGIMNLSQIGFNKTRTQALVYYGEQVGQGMGSGSGCLFEKENGSWKLIDYLFMWMN
jgi:hypothetical protein